MVIKGAQLGPRKRADVRIRAGLVTEVAPKVRAEPGEDCVVANDCCLLPGLHDHHLHLYALAAARESLVCGPPEVNRSDQLYRRLVAHANRQTSFIRGTGYHESVAGELDAAWLDRACPSVPAKIQHRSGRLWMLNSAAIALLPPASQWPNGAEKTHDGHPTGRFYHLDGWLREQLPALPPSLSATSRELARYGITGITDAGPDNDAVLMGLIERSQANGALRQRVLLMGRDDLPSRDSATLSRGPVKLYLRESALPDFDALCSSIRRAHAANRNVAFHCVSRAELHYALSAMDYVGSRDGDRVEHASVADDEAIRRLASLGMTVVTQPNFIFERGDQYLKQVPVEEQNLLYRGSAFLEKGIRFAAGSDAPFGHPDPWLAMRAAVARRTRAGVAMQTHERLQPGRALALFLGAPKTPAAPRRITPGTAADICLVRGNWQDVTSDPDCQRVQLTLIAGDPVWSHQA